MFFSGSNLLSLIFVFASAASAHAQTQVKKISIGETQFPAQVDLSNQYREVVSRQKGGSCHVFASSALVEANCFRKLGKHVDLSEAYLMNQHLQKKLKSVEALDLDEGCVKNPNYVIPNAALDGGHSYKTLNIIKTHGVCTEEEFTGYIDFIGGVQGLVEQYVEKADSVRGVVEKDTKYRIDEISKTFDPKLYNLQSKIAYQQRQLEAIEMGLNGVTTVNFREGRPGDRAAPDRKKIEERLDELEQELNEVQDQRSNKIVSLKKELSSTPAQVIAYEKQLPKKILETLSQPIEERSPSSIIKTRNRDLRECLSKGLKIEKSEFSVSKAVDLLSRGIPFICQSRINYGAGVRSAHSFNVIGYRYNPKFRHNLDFQIRDSNLDQAKWGWNVSCQVMVYIE